ncbi:hypothetical protein [Eikenella corrodens]|uniref:hypothetical protein n=2 Tax=Eikenella corrodens TaxID=539 RepID=UPI000B4D5055|nr:hypothetical protein [Eikenella corrodens]OWP26982.1 hypothetical protein CA838_01340 [Eikenella corrodens]
MKYIHTTADTLEHLRQQAKKRQNKQGGKIAELLNRAAQEAKYQSWHHAEICHQAGERFGRTPLTEECHTVVEHTRAGQDYVTATGFETATPSAYLLFNTDQGDAWLYDVFSRQALCLMHRHKEAELTPIRFADKRFTIEWDGQVDLSTPIPSLDPETDAARAKLGGRYLFPEYVSLMIEDLGSQAARQAHQFFQNEHGGENQPASEHEHHGHEHGHNCGCNH